MNRLIPSSVLAVVTAIAVAGCGGDSEKEKGDEKPDAATLSGAFTKATGVQLKARDSEPWTALGPENADTFRRFGSFTIYVVNTDTARDSLLEGPLAGDVKDYGDDVLVSARSEDGASSRRLDQAMKAALANDPSLIPATERPCSALGIDPAKGKEGTCRLEEKQLTVVSSATELATPVLRAKLTSTTVVPALPQRTEYSEVKRAKGRYVVVRYALTNAGRRPISSIRPALVVGENTYTESPDAYSLVDYTENPLPVQPGASSTLTTAFDVPEPAAEEAARSGQLELPAATYAGSDSLSDDEAIGRIRLAGAPKLALASGVSSSSSSSGSGSSASGSSRSSLGSATARGREAAAEDALKEFYSALHKGNVKFVCRRLTRAAQQMFGGASSCSAGRVINTKAKAKAPSSNVGLRFTTILTNGQTRALILVRRQNGGFTDTARMARQGNLWRVQGTRRLSARGG